jgi:hypothetical protein
VTDHLNPADALRAIHESDADSGDKCDMALNVLKDARSGNVTEMFLELRDTIFASTEARTHMIVRSFTTDLDNHSGPLGNQEVLGVAAQMLGMAAILLEPISVEAGFELDRWKQFFEEMVRNCPARKSYRCAHCGDHRDDMFAVMDDWVLCLTTSDGTPSCFTRVHDYGEPLGSGKANVDDGDDGRG